jgi:hypothetical protein
MRFRARLLAILALSVFSMSALSIGCWNDDSVSADDGGAGKGGRGGTGDACGKAGTGGSCERAGTGGVGGTPGAAGNGPWPPFGQPVNGECGVPPEPRWGFELYEDANSIQFGKLGGKHIDVMGTVTDVGDGVPDDLNRSSDEADLRYVRIASAGHTYTIVTYGAPGAGAKLAVGTQVSLKHNDDTCDYVLCSPTNVFTTLSSDGVVTMLYTPLAASTPEGYSASVGMELCEGRSHCASWSGNTLEVTSPSGVTLEFTPGEVDELGDYTIYVGAVRRFKEKNNLESARSECADTIGNSAQQLLFVRFE